MSKQKTCGGVVVPMITPFRADGDVDLAAAARITEHLVTGGASVFVLGTTGEAVSIDIQTKVRLAKAVVAQNAGRMKVYAGISDNCLTNSLDMARQFSSLGVDVAVAHVPNYYPLAERDVVQYFEQLADKSMLPLMLYNIPMTTGISVSLRAIDQLSHHPNIVGLKDSEKNLVRLQEATTRWKGRDFSYLTGCGALCWTALTLGADGIVPGAGNIAPALFGELYEAAVQGRKRDADQLQVYADQIADVFLQGRIISQALPVLKAIMHLLGFCDLHVLPPLSRVTSQQIEELKAHVQRLKALTKERAHALPNLETPLSRIQDVPQTGKAVKASERSVSSEENK